MEVNVSDVNSTSTMIPGVITSMNKSSPEQDDMRSMEDIFSGILVACCMVAMLVNMLVFVSVYWIRGPMTPILKMALSLAAADACSSFMFATAVFLATNFPSMETYFTSMELIRLSCLIVTAAHLLALSLNHYIGILKPLHYNSIVTAKKVVAIIAFLWLAPIVLVSTLCTFEEGISFWKNIFSYELNRQFMGDFSFRIFISAMFFIPLILMVIFYMHILLIVKRQQKIWKGLSRTGSTKWRGRAVKTCATSRVQREQTQMEGTIKAIYTTLFILGSCFIGWVPALIEYTLICPTGCLISGAAMDDLNDNYSHMVTPYKLLEHILVILKMLANPIIYSIRMKEIQDGLRRMYQSLSGVFCPWREYDNGNYLMSCHRSPIHRSSGSQARVASFKTNGNTSHITIGRSDCMDNTFL